MRIRLFATAASLVLLAGVTSRPVQTSPRADVPKIDPKAVAVLQAMDDAFAQAEGLVATYRSESVRLTGQPAGTEETTLRLGRPNLFELRTKSGTRERVLASDGKTRFEYATGSTGCSTWDVAPRNEWREISTFNPIYWSFFDLGQWQIRSALLGHWATTWRLNDPGLRSVRYLSQDTVGGVPVDLVEWTYTIGYNRPDDDPVYTSVLAIGRDHLVRRIETTSSGGRAAEGRRTVETIAEIKVTPRPAIAEFAVKLPAGAKCTRVDPNEGYVTGKYVDLPVGSIAPDFTLKTARGESVHFAEFVKQHKLVLMNYWGYG